MAENIKTTAARLDRFKRPDHWTQRRVEEGFAFNAACFSASNRAIKGAAWNRLKGKCEKVELEIWKGLVENMKDLSSVPWYMKFHSSFYLTDEHKKILKSFETEDEFDAYFKEKFYSEIVNSLEKISIVDAAEMLRKDDIEYLEDKLNAVEAQLLDGALESLKRMDKENKDWLSQLPETEKKSPSIKASHESLMVPGKEHYLGPDETLECCAGYRQENGKLTPDHLAVFDHEVKNFRRVILKAFEPILVPCLRFLVRAIDEVKDAFSFFWYDRHKKPEQPGYIWELYKNHFAETKSLIRYGKLYDVSRFPFEPNWLFRKRIMKVIEDIDQKAQSMRY